MQKQTSTIRSIRNILLAMLLGLLAACETVQEIPDTEIPDAEQQATLEQLEQEGQYGKIAEILLQQARSTTPPSIPLTIRATNALLKAGQADRAREILSRLQADPGKPEQQVAIQLALAEVDLHQGQAEQAMNRLIVNDNLPVALRAKTHELRARALSLSGNTLESARERMLLEPLLTETEVIEQNREIIWELLRQLSAVMLTQMTTEPPPSVLSGWLELANIAKSYIQQPELFETEISKWKTRYPQHPAGQSILSKLYEYYRSIKRPEKLALILPLGGKLAKPAAAIRDGFLAAYYQNSNNLKRTRIKVYNSSASGKSIEQIYNLAVAEGAEFIIGPLQKTNVAKLANLTELSVPVLTLNQTSILPSVTDNFFQFGLNPEDEARQIAERASLEGMIKSIVIAPRGSWGDRLAQTFTKRFEELGGIVLEEARYDFASHDLSRPIKRMLNLDESQRRYNMVRNAVPSEIKFEPRRRQDVDFIFMAAFPKQARLITPQLRFHRAADIPVYATSHAYNGYEDVQANRDMNGVQLCDSGWVLQPKVNASPLRKQFFKVWPQSTQNYARLYALGIDAFQLPAQVKWLKLNPSERFDGVTGRLQLNPSNQIIRTLKWGRFHNGRINMLEDIQRTPELTEPTLTQTEADTSQP